MRFDCQFCIKINVRKELEKIFKQGNILTSISFIIQCRKEYRKLISFIQYIVTDNSFANRLIELNLGNKVQNLEKQKFDWYLQPEEAMYLISVATYGQEEHGKIYRKQFIEEIYKNCQSQDIDVVHFYLNLRKRNKSCKRVDGFSFVSNIIMSKTADSLKNESIPPVFNEFQIKKYKIFKVYQTTDDYKKDQNFNLFLLVQAQQKISSILFDPDLQRIKKAFGIEILHLCIIENNDFIVTEIKFF